MILTRKVTDESALWVINEITHCWILKLQALGETCVTKKF